MSRPLIIPYSGGVSRRFLPDSGIYSRCSSFGLVDIPRKEKMTKTISALTKKCGGAERADHLKNPEGGREEMCKIMEEIINDSVRQEKFRLAINLITRGKDTAQEISDLTGLTIEEVDQLAAQLTSITA